MSHGSYKDMLKKNHYLLETEMLYDFLSSMSINKDNMLIYHIVYAFSCGLAIEINIKELTLFFSMFFDQNYKARVGLLLTLAEVSDEVIKLSEFIKLVRIILINKRDSYEFLHNRKFLISLKRWLLP